MAIPQVTARFTYPGTLNSPSLVDVQILGSGDTNLPLTFLDGWCVDTGTNIGTPLTYTANVYSSYELNTLSTALPWVGDTGNQGNLDRINWIINQDYTSQTNGGQAYTSGDIQIAVWTLLGDVINSYDYSAVGSYSQANVDKIIAESVSGIGFVPTPDQYIGLILDPVDAAGTHQQPIFCPVKAAAIGDFVWLDGNANGVQDAGETGVAGVVVNLGRDLNNDGDINDAGELLATQTTDSQGKYEFNGLAPGLEYQVQFVKPSGLEFTQANVGNNTTDSNASVTGDTTKVILAPGEFNKTIDAGLVQPVVAKATIGDKVWEDTNTNGIQDAGELGIAGVTVILKDSSGNPLTSTTTDSNGNYSFSVDPGIYSVAIVAPTGFVPTAPNQGVDPSKDSNFDNVGQSAPVTVAAGENNPTIDAGLYKLAELGDRVWLDTNKNGIQDAGEAGVQGVKVTLLDGSGNPVGSPLTTDANGNYLFTGLKPGTYSVQFDKTTLPAGYSFTSQDQGANEATDSDANPADGKTIQTVLESGESDLTWDAGIVAPVAKATIGDKVWEDTNANGIQDAGELGIAGVTVVLKDASGNPLTSTTTDSNGNYSFSVDPGTYSVAIEAPAGFVPTAPNQGGDPSKDSNINAQGQTANVTVVEGENNPTIDAGLYKLAELGDRVWLDTNKNGLQDAGETGVQGVKVTLLDGSGNPVGSPLTTDANGNYLFTGLKPGTYSVQFDKTTLPAGYSFTSRDQGLNDTADSDANPVDGKTIQTVLDAGESDLTWDAGIVAPVAKATIGDRVWEDTNANGIQDAGELGIAGVTVVLKDASGNPLTSTITDSNGNYSFTVDPGTYSITVVSPSGYVPVYYPIQVGDPATDSNIDAAGNTNPFTVAPGENNPTIDAGLFRLAELGDRVWLDTNKNGIQDAGEAGVQGVKVTLLDVFGNPVGSPLLTDANGNYLFNNLVPGKYSVQFDKTTLPAGYSFTSQDQGANDATDSDANPADGKTIQTVLDSGESDLTWDAGIVAPVAKATIGDKVWQDTNANGIQDAGELGIAGVTVVLKDASGNPLTSTTTDSNGNYSFSVDPGTYSVAIVAPAGFVPTAPNQGGDPSKDSNINAQGQTANVTVVEGENNPTIDAGLYKLAQLGDRVWLDTNKNGIQDAGEAGVQGVKVTLLDGSGNPVGSPLTTDANGNYLFTGLKPGTYSVQFDKTTLPAGYSFTSQDQGANDATDSDANPVDGKTIQTVLESGESDLTWDAGIIAPVAKATIGDKVWQDTNANGIQDAGELGIAGVTVVLKDASGNPITSTTTDSNGNYSFSVDPGTYSVAIVAPTGFVPTTPNQGGDPSKDSNINAQGQTANVTVVEGENNPTIDAGLYKLAELGDRVWLDTNKNGIQDAGEAGVQGVKVTLLDGSGNPVGSPLTTDANGNYLFTGLKPGTYSVQFDKTTLPAGYSFTSQDQGANDATDSDANPADGKTIQTVLDSGESDLTWDAGIVAPVAKATIGDKVWLDTNANGIQDAGELGIAGVTVVLKDAGGNPLTSTITDSNGNYSFSVDPGTYSVAIVAPAGFVPTAPNQGGDPSKDSNINAQGQTANVTVVEGENNPTIDAGLYKLAQLGDRVWLDTNKNGIQDAGEAGVQGVKVTLLDGSGNPVGSPLTTDANGNYLFTGLKPGTYSVQFDKTTLPAGYSFTSQDQGLNDAADSDANPADGKTIQTVLDSGESDLTWDAGIVAPVLKGSIGDRVWVDNNCNGIQESGEKGLAGVTVKLYQAGADGQFGTADDVTVATQTTDVNGNYLFTNLLAGNYQVGFSNIGSTAEFTVADVNGNTMDTLDSDVHANITNLIVNGSFESGAAGWKGKGDSVEVGKASLYCVNGATGSNVLELDANVCGSGTGVYQDVATQANRTYELYLDVAARGYTKLSTNTVEVYWQGQKIATIDPQNTTLTTYKFTVVGSGGLDRLQFLEQNGDDDSLGGIIDNVRLLDSSTDGRTGIINLAAGQNRTDVDAGICGDSILASLGDKVWEDKNFNGIQDAGENGISGVTVKLLNAAGSVVSTTTTDSSGNYLFKDLNPGDYSVQVVAPSGYYATKQNVGTNDAIDSDIDSSGKTATTTLVAGENDLSWDAGLYRKASIGDKVWEDMNHNNIQDVNEPGIGGIKVMLQNSAGQTIATTYTNSAGNYNFGGLDPDNYRLVFDKTNVMYKSGWGGTFNMSNWSWAAQDVGTNDNIDSDVVGNGRLTTNVTNTAYTFLESGENDMSWDAALTPIAIDLNGDGIHTIARADAQGSFDLLGNGHAIQSGWLSGQDGFLAVDANGNGKIDDIHELFGGNKGEGFAKLATYDSNGDGFVNASDADFSKLLVWQDANSNHQTDAGELISLTDAGIASLTVSFTELPFLDAQQNLHLERSSATLTDGQSVNMTDVYFNVSATDAAAAGVKLPSIAQLMGDDRGVDNLLANLPDAGSASVATTNDINYTSDISSLNVTAHLDEYANQLAYVA